MSNTVVRKTSTCITMIGFALAALSPVERPVYAADFVYAGQDIKEISFILGAYGAGMGTYLETCCLVAADEAARKHLAGILRAWAAAQRDLHADKPTLPPELRERIDWAEFFAGALLIRPLNPNTADYVRYWQAVESHYNENARRWGWPRLRSQFIHFGAGGGGEDEGGQN